MLSSTFSNFELHLCNQSLDQEAEADAESETEPPFFDESQSAPVHCAKI